MTPQERDLITQLLGRLAQAGGQPKDPEAESLIRQAVAAQPDAPYYLVQTVLIQDMALSNAQSRIQALEQQLAAAKPAPSQPTSFLGGLFGGGAAASNQGSGGSVPSAGPWSRPAPAAPAQQAAPQWQGQPGQGQPGQGQPGYGQPAYPQPGYGPGVMGPGMMGPGMMGMGGGSGFLRSAATTAAGIAGGALLFQGIQSMFGSHAGGILSGTSMQPGLSETVINNYYGNDPAGNAPQTAAWDQGTDSNIEPADYAADNTVDPDPGYADQDFASDQDFGGSDSDSV